ncbi:glycerophosphodiester phosphodiesterase [Rhizobium mesoamericanum]|uniref:glycerophosphodiester phosphodiesterase n=1 Tax=Rhizobium mesoamericanum TaxID=1079800 RepID=UPI000401E5CC|nr:glycerophosphodiester phosphodiesterase family protein [Rhizobium mesoamericanum]
MAIDLWKRAPARGPLAVAHRGGAALAAENSISAFKAAAAAGADAIETDIRSTRDGVPVCVHDADLHRLCNDPRAVSDLDLATLRSLLPSVMTLGEALEASDPLGILLDIKLSHEDQIAQIIADVGQHDATRRTLIGLRKITLIDSARHLSDDIAILAFLEDPACADAARAAGADWFRLWQASATPPLSDAVRELGMRVAVMVGQPRSIAVPEYPPFPVGRVDQQGLERILSIAPDAILLDDPRMIARAPTAST